jgi:hypothetical protein
MYLGINHSTNHFSSCKLQWLHHTRMLPNLKCCWNILTHRSECVFNCLFYIKISVLKHHSAPIDSKICTIIFFNKLKHLMHVQGQNWLTTIGKRDCNVSYPSPWSLGNCFSWFEWSKLLNFPRPCHLA